MKFEIDPNELTTEQRAHVAAFITGWPVVKLARDKIRATEEAVKSVLNFDQGIAAVKFDPVTNAVTPIHNEDFYITEEQRLDSEQKRDMDTTGELNETSVANLNTIFGTPLPPGTPNHSVPLDKEGLPWDGRIHASTKTFVADGSWKLRRGVDPISVDMVKHQLKELMAVPAYHGEAVASPDKAPFAPVLQNEMPMPTPPAPKSHYLIDQQPVDNKTVEWGLKSDGIPKSYVAPAPKSHYLIDQQPATVTLTDLIGRMSSAIVAGKMTQATVNEMCAKHGVSEFMLLSSRPDLLPLIDADMKAMGV